MCKGWKSRQGVSFVKRASEWLKSPKSGMRGIGVR